MTVYCVMRGSRLQDIWATRELAEQDVAKRNAMYPRGTQAKVVPVPVKEESTP